MPLFRARRAKTTPTSPWEPIVTRPPSCCTRPTGSLRKTAPALPCSQKLTTDSHTRWTDERGPVRPPGADPRPDAPARGVPLEPVEQAELLLEQEGAVERPHPPS